MVSVVIMGVAGCGKSSLGRAVADACGLPLIEGDDFHGPDSRAKMRAGVPLTDADRSGWLDALAHELVRRPRGAVLTCSALKRSYRDRLRSAVPRLRFVYLQIDREAARQRVAPRAAEHFFPASLVDSQFETLEPPTGEPGVLTVGAQEPVAVLREQVQDWLAQHAS
jgi:gluconokinase